MAASNPELGWVASDLLRKADTYDATVGVVSAFHWFHTEQPDLSGAVRRFERYPKLRHPDGNPATPDFLIEFEDDGVLVGEIANLPLHDEGVENLCRQIGRYDSFEPVEHDELVTNYAYIDVLLIVDGANGTAAVNRVIKERLLSSDHAYSPSRPPCIVTALPVESGYVFARHGDASNGRLTEVGRNGIGQWFDESDPKIKATYFQNNKARWVFANDPIDRLYLATHLWSREFASFASRMERAGRFTPLRVNSTDLASELRERYGKCTESEVVHALELLVRGGFAKSLDAHTWEIAWGDVAGGGDLRAYLAARAEKPPKQGAIRTLDRSRKEAAKTAKDEPPQLFSSP